MFVFLLALCVASASANPLSRIVGGDAANIADHPHQVSLRSGGSHICGGSLVAENWVLTAAHCVTGTSGYSVQLNDGLRSSTSNDEIITVTKVIRHLSYNTGSGAFPNDIALLKLQKAFTSSDHETIALASGSSLTQFDGQTCTITGWGRVSGSGALPDGLLETTGVILSTSDCKTHWSTNINSNGHICIHNVNTGACNGDSGGPMVCGSGSERVLAGVTSWGASGCLTNLPSVYTRVSYFNSWIQETMRAN